MTMICGHERNELLCVLRWAVGDDKRDRTKARCECGGPCCVIYNDLIDPAKLSAMLAARGRELGVERWEFAEWAGKVLCCFRRKHGAKVQESDTRELEPAQARAILLQWLQLPDGAQKEALRALGVTT